MEQRRYWFTEEPQGESYAGLITLGLQFADRILLVVRPNLGLADSATAVLERFRQWRVSSQAKTEWPGTKLYEGETARVDEYSLAWESAEVLTHAADRLYAWVQPSLPEDLSLLRSDGEPWLMTIADEKEAFLFLTSEEYHQVREQSPIVARLLLQDEPGTERA
jgi:hypothetical protein